MTGTTATEPKQFVTPSMSILLDAVRGIAALLVLGGHTVQLGLYTGPYPFSQTMQHNAVLVFFVLSGLVIANSVQNRHYTLCDYAIARSARILPVSLFAVLFSSVVFFGLTSSGITPTHLSPYYDELSWSSMLLPTFFLSESSFGSGPVLNPPYWSLVYEVWFYALFAVGFFLRGWRKWFWLVLLSAIAGWRIILMLPVWLIGAALVKVDFASDLKPLRAMQIGLLGLIALLLSNRFGAAARDVMLRVHEPIGYSLKFSEYFLTDYLFGIGIALLFVAARPLSDFVSKGLNSYAGPIRWFAGISFSIYILHWPILLVLSSLGIGAGSSSAMFLVLVSGIVGLCALIAQFTEYRSPQLRRWLRNRFMTAQADPATA